MRIAVVEFESGFTIAIEDCKDWTQKLSAEATRLKQKGRAVVSFFRYDSQLKTYLREEIPVHV